MTAVRFPPSPPDGTVLDGSLIWDGAQWVNQLVGVDNIDATLTGLIGSGGFPFAAITAPTNGTDASTAIQTALNSGPGNYYLGETTSVTYTIMNPIYLRNGTGLWGRGAMQGGTSIIADTTFPHTTISGSQTTPASEATSFTLTVASTTGFPLASGGVTPPGGVGVLCVNGVTIYYTGATSTTFTGCKAALPDQNVTLADATAVGTFMVFLGGPGETSIGFGMRLDHLALNANEVPGASCVHSCHVQEGGGGAFLRLTSFRNFGIREDSNPNLAGTDEAINNTWEHMWVIRSASDEPNSVAIDLMQGYSATHTAKFAEFRGLRSISMTTRTNVHCNGKAGFRLNGTPGTFQDFAIENQHVGVMVGDTYPCAVTILGVTLANDWGSGANDCGVQLGATTGNSADVRKVVKLSASGVPNRKTLVDLLNATAYTDEQITYELNRTGAYRVNNGALRGTAAQRPDSSLYSGVYVATDTGHASVSFGGSGFKLLSTIDGILPAQDNVASGARDNSNASTLTVTFTKAVPAGHHLLMAATQSGNFLLTTITDSTRSNTWQVDKSLSNQGPSANIASCLVTTPYQIGDQITLTYGGSSTYSTAIISEWSGLKSSSWFDVAAAQGAASGTTATTTATTTRGQADELLFAMIAYADASVPTPSASGFTAMTGVTSGAGNRQIQVAYRVVSSVGTDAATWTTISLPYDAAIATYKAAVATS